MAAANDDEHAALTGYAAGAPVEQLHGLFEDSGFGMDPGVPAAQLPPLPPAAAREAEQRLRVLFACIDEGFALCQLVDDARGRAVDVRLLEANPAFERMTGLRGAAGKTMQQLGWPVEQPWLEIFDRVARSGRAERTERFAERMGRWFEVSVSRMGGDGSRRVTLVFNDVTERKRAEAALRDSEQRHRLIVEQARDYAILTTDAQGRIESWSPGAQAVFGWTAQQAVGKPIDMTFVPEDRAQGVPQAELEQARRDGSAPDVRWHQRRDGTAVFIEGTTRALADGRGGVHGFLKIGQDVTQRRRLDEALRASEARFRHFVHNVKDYAIFFLDAEGRVTEWTDGADRVTGYAAAEAMGRHISLIYPTEAVAKGEVERELAEAAAHGRAEREDWRVRKGGERFWVNEVLTAVYDDRGTVVGFATVSRDLSDRRRADEALRASQAALAAELAEVGHLHELVVRLLGREDLPGALDEVLDSSLALMHATMGSVQLVDPVTGELHIAVHRGCGEAFLRRFARGTPDEASASGRALRSRERVVVQDVERDPAYAPLRGVAGVSGYRSLQCTPLLGRDGLPLGMLSTFWSQPHLPRERELRMLDLYARQAADFIEHQRTLQALRQVAEDLSAADRRKDEFLAMLAHELRNPLAPISNALALLRMAPGRPVNPALYSMLERQVTHMVRLIDDLLEVSRISRGSIELQREPLELGAVLRTALETSEPLVKRGGHRLDVSLPAEPLPVQGDAVRLAQVFANLLNNAAKYTDEGGRLALEAQREHGCAVVRVRDNGIGIPREELPRMFELFTQLEQAGTRAQGGLGIGLHLVKRLVQMHGGSVRADSEGPGHGATFTVELPLRPQPERSEAVPGGEDDGGAGATAAHADAAGEPAASPRELAGQRQSAADDLRGLRLMVVDDNRDAADSLAMLLGCLGAQVRVEHGGGAALAALPDWRPAAVLLDLGMPGMDGFEVARRIRADPRLAGVKLVAITGWGQPADRERTRAAGFDHHLTKPVGMSELRPLLDGVLSA